MNRRKLFADGGGSAGGDPLTKYSACSHLLRIGGGTNPPSN